jgi:hypothetical protein
MTTFRMPDNWYEPPDEVEDEDMERDLADEADRWNDEIRNGDRDEVLS